MERKTYHIVRILPKSVFRKDYPENPKTFGEHLRKARIDAGLLIKGLASKLGVTEDSVINWEVRGRMPRPRARETLRRVFPALKQWPQLSLAGNKAYVIVCK